MKYGMSSLNYAAPFRDEDAWTIGHLRSLGFDIVEITVWERDLFDVQAAASEFKRQGVEPVVLTQVRPESSLTDTDAAVRAAGIDHLRYCIDVAETLGASFVTGEIAEGPGILKWRSPEDFQADIDRSAAALREVAPYASERGVTLVFEPLNRYESSFCIRAEEAVRLVDAVDSPSFRMMLDTFHADIEEKSIPQAVRTAGDRLVYVQVMEHDRGVPGTGHLDWYGLRDALKEIGYPGPVVIAPGGHQNRVPATHLRLWHDAQTSSPDETASEGLRFLKTVFEEGR
jgi:D-psicose/D-tagatose/L-ribulose 3-epimerase